MASGHGKRQVVVEPKEATLATVADTIRQHQRDQELHSGAAAKLRVVSGLMATNSHGRVGRIGLGAIKLRQYAKDGVVALTDQLNVAFDFFFGAHCDDSAARRRRGESITCTTTGIQ